MFGVELMSEWVGTYCVPEAGVPLLPSTHLLTTPEIERVAKLFVNAGVTKIRLTFGEPTVRKDLLDVVRTCPSSCDRTGGKHIIVEAVLDCQSN
mgnify:FL=1